MLLFQVMDLCSGTFFLYFLLLLCASFMPLGHDVVAEAGCNWYLRDINIYSLSKKKGKGSSKSLYTLQSGKLRMLVRC